MDIASSNTDYSMNAEIMRNMYTNTGDNLLKISFQQPVMLVFLRHFGCTFCREALSDISKRKKEIEAAGVRLVFVHMAENEVAERYFTRYDLPDVLHISDPGCNYYAQFGLLKGSFNQLFGLKFWIRGFNTTVFEGNVPGPKIGDGFQMPGVFVISEGEVKNSFIHKSVADRPDYQKLVEFCVL